MNKSEITLCTQEIRKTLKNNFKNVKFSVTKKDCEIFARYENGPTASAVECVLNKYRRNGPPKSDVPTANYITIYRKCSDALKKRIQMFLDIHHGIQGTKEHGEDFHKIFGNLSYPSAMQVSHETLRDLYYLK